jgi:uncharacterized protein
MPFLIYALDKENMEEVRESVRSAHREYLRSYGSKVLASGALLSEDGTRIIGGLSLFDTEDAEEARSFAFEDPYEKAGIRSQTCVLRWRKRWWEGKFLLNE